MGLLKMSKAKCSVWLRNLLGMTVCCDYLLYNNPEPCEKDIAVAVFTSAGSSRCSVCFIGRTRRFQASCKGKPICKIYAGICCDTNKFRCHFPGCCGGISAPGRGSGGMVSGDGCPGGWTGPGWALLRRRPAALCRSQMRSGAAARALGFG
jgi:hypothetical protein